MISSNPMESECFFNNIYEFQRWKASIQGQGGFSYICNKVKLQIA